MTMQKFIYQCQNNFKNSQTSTGGNAGTSQLCYVWTFFNLNSKFQVPQVGLSLLQYQILSMWFYSAICRLFVSYDIVIIYQACNRNEYTNDCNTYSKLYERRVFEKLEGVGEGYFARKVFVAGWPGNMVTRKIFSFLTLMCFFLRSEPRFYREIYL